LPPSVLSAWSDDGIETVVPEVQHVEQERFLRVRPNDLLARQVDQARMWPPSTRLTIMSSTVS
jgi:hypothetical protein